MSIFMADTFDQKIDLTGMTTASTDYGESRLSLATMKLTAGNVCYKLPSISPNFGTC